MWFAACAAAVAALSASAVEFSKAGYWEAEGSPRRIETLTTGWEFSLDGFKTSKRVALPRHDEGWQAENRKGRAAMTRKTYCGNQV